MTPWNEEIVEKFTELREAMRAAMRAKNYRDAIALGSEIVAMERPAAFLRIATQLFLRDMGRASLAIGDHEAAERYLVQARQKFVENKARPEDWEKDIAIIDRRLEKLRRRLLRG